MSSTCEWLYRLGALDTYVSDSEGEESDYSDSEWINDVDQSSPRSDTSVSCYTLRKIPLECVICMDDPEDKITLNCGHSFCKDCLGDYIKFQVQNNFKLRHYTEVKVTEEKTNQWSIHTIKHMGIACPCADCPQVLSQEVAAQAVPELVAKLASLTINKFATENGLRYCPDPNCKGIIATGWKCTDCKLSFCCKCLGETHDLPCEKVSRWIYRPSKYEAHMKFGKWGANSTKLCPSCYATIEKNGGCDHMHCYKCKTSFLWSQAPSFRSDGGWWKPNLVEKDETVNRERKFLVPYQHHQKLIQDIIKSNRNPPTVKGNVHSPALFGAGGRHKKDRAAAIKKYASYCS